jgi:hypothetical protein
MGKIQVQDIASVYSGKPGCMCGCRGKYYCASALGSQRDKVRGYGITSEKVSDRQVKRIIDLMNGNPSTEDKGNHYFLDLGTRWYVAYKK